MHHSVCFKLSLIKTARSSLGTRTVKKHSLPKVGQYSIFARLKYRTYSAEIPCIYVQPPPASSHIKPIYYITKIIKSQALFKIQYEKITHYFLSIFVQDVQKNQLFRQYRQRHSICKRHFSRKNCDFWPKFHYFLRFCLFWLHFVHNFIVQYL